MQVLSDTKTSVTAIIFNSIEEKKGIITQLALMDEDALVYMQYDANVLSVEEAIFLSNELKRGAKLPSALREE